MGMMARRRWDRNIVPIDSSNTTVVVAARIGLLLGMIVRNGLTPTRGRWDDGGAGVVARIVVMRVRLLRHMMLVRVRRDLLLLLLARRGSPRGRIVRRHGGAAYTEVRLLGFFQVLKVRKT